MQERHRDHELDDHELERTERLLEQVLRSRVDARDGVTWDELRHAASAAAGTGDEGIIWDDVALAALALHSAASRPVPPAVAERHLSAMHEALDHVLVMPRRPRRGLAWRRRLAGATAAITAFTTFGGGAVAMAQEHQPGDPLYGLKRATERAQLLIETSAEGDAALHLKFALERLEEMQAVPEAADDLADDALDSIAQARQNGDAETRAAADAAGAKAVEVLTALLEDGGLPAEASDNAREALTRARDRIAAHLEDRAGGVRGRDQAPGQQQERPHGPDDGGRPDDAPGGAPDAPGRPEGVGGGRPDQAGQPEGS